MQVKPTVTYGVTMSSVSRRRRTGGGRGFKKFLKFLVVIMFIAACVCFIKFGIIDFFSSGDRAASYIASGDECMANGDYQGALEDFSKAFEIEDTNADACAACGDAYTALEKYDAAQKAYDSALKLNSKCERAYLGYINMYITLGDGDNARSRLAKAEKAGIEINNDEWSLLKAKVPETVVLYIADDELHFAEGSFKADESRIIYTDKATDSERVVYTGSPAKGIASNGKSLYIYDTGSQELVISDAATGLWHKLTDVYVGAESSDEYYGKGRFCGCSATLLYFSEQHSENDFKTFYIDTKDGTYHPMEGVSMKSVVLASNKLYYMSNDSGLYSCDFTGGEVTEICKKIKDKAVFSNTIIYTEPVDGYIVNVWKYNMASNENELVASSLNVYLINGIYEDYMSYYSINEKTSKTKLETISY